MKMCSWSLKLDNIISYTYGIAHSNAFSMRFLELWVMCSKISALLSSPYVLVCESLPYHCSFHRVFNLTDILLNFRSSNGEIFQGAYWVYLNESLTDLLLCHTHVPDLLFSSPLPCWLEYNHISTAEILNHRPSRKLVVVVWTSSLNLSPPFLHLW